MHTIFFLSEDDVIIVSSLKDREVLYHFHAVYDSVLSFGLSAMSKKKVVGLMKVKKNLEKMWLTSLKEEFVTLTIISNYSYVPLLYVLH